MATIKDNPGRLCSSSFSLCRYLFALCFTSTVNAYRQIFFYTSTSTVIGIIVILSGLFINVPAISRFVNTKNTLVTIKPATSLVTSGIYSRSRNPTYLSLLLLYTGIALLFGNWWTIILVPVLAAIITLFIIKPEERYLERAFGKDYLEYKAKVRRWI